MKLKSYLTITFFDYFFYYPFIKRLSVVRPLNFMPYSKNDALLFLKNQFGYKEYGLKHCESRFTKFFQNYYLTKKFNIDKRIPHYSSLILSGQLKKESALIDLKKPLYSENELIEDKIFIAKKLGLTLEELEELISSPGRSYSEYPNWDMRYKYYYQ